MSTAHETRPLGLSKEIGSLRAIDQGVSHFVGSSSGVFFVNTVRRAFAVSASRGAAVGSPSRSRDPSPERFIAGNDDSHESAELPSLQGDSASSIVGDNLGQLPEYSVAKKLMMVYFKSWHPLFPFLHGPSISRDLESLYFGRYRSASKEDVLSCSIMLRCIFNIALLDSPIDGFPPGSKFQSPSALITMLSPLALHNDIYSVQTLLAAQLYLVSVMSLRAASTVGGMIFKSIYNAGLHRCPYRYEQISLPDRDIRKRIFWSAYAIDRYLSQALGHPLGIQDSDIDVCTPGIPDLHEPVIHRAQPTIGESPTETILHLPGNNTDVIPDDVQAPTNMVSQRRQERQAAQSYFVKYGRLVGRALELFHKSIDKRWTEKDDVLFLKADIHEWWHELPPTLSEITRIDEPWAMIDADRQKYDLAGFFTVLYHNLILIVNRPSLSLETSTPEFRSALQTCIGSARTIISTLKTQTQLGQSLFWPGNMSSAWMAGLIVAFGCQLNLYQKPKGLRDISSCLDLLKIMARRWSLAKHCHYVLNRLLISLNTSNITRSQNVRTEKINGRRRSALDDACDLRSSEGNEPAAKRAQRVRPSSVSENEQTSDRPCDVVTPNLTRSPISNSHVHANGYVDALNDSQSNDQQDFGFPSRSSGAESFNDATTLDERHIKPPEAFDFMNLQPNESDLQSLFGADSCDIFEGITWEALNSSMNMNEF